SRRHQLRAAAPQRLREPYGPAVLEDQDSRRRAGFDRCTRTLEVGLVQEPRRGAIERGQIELAVMVEVRQLDAEDRTVLVTGDEHQIEDPDHPAVHEIDQDWKTFARHFAAWELDDQIADRPHRFVIARHCHHLLGEYHTSLIVGCTGRRCHDPIWMIAPPRRVSLRGTAWADRGGRGPLPST